MPAAVPGVNKGAPLTKWSRRVSSTSGSRSVHETPGAAVIDTKSRPKKTPSTMPLSNRARASGEASADSASAKSRVPESSTGWPGRNLRVAGLGVCSVRISMALMWAASLRGSRRSPVTERRGAGDDPARDSDADRKADQRNPPFAAAHRFGSGLDLSTPGNHRPGELPSAESIIGYCSKVQDDQRQDQVEPELVDVARLVGGADAYQPGKWARVDAVLVFGDQAEANLDCKRDKHRDDAERPQRVVADSDPAALEMIGERPRSPDKAGPARCRASDEAPQQPKDQQGQDRAARPDVPVGVMLVNRPPAERNQCRDQPVDEADR